MPGIVPDYAGGFRMVMDRDIARRAQEHAQLVAARGVIGFDYQRRSCARSTPHAEHCHACGLGCCLDPHRDRVATWRMINRQSVARWGSAVRTAQVLRGAVKGESVAPLSG